ncbi:hypothetical protein B0H13DRAFT_1884709 [Mycena leptocephala]|nr:hypothetical protein B0H13DRAFT_1884709 [Mycena leptocephala]
MWEDGMKEGKVQVFPAWNVIGYDVPMALQRGSASAISRHLRQICVRRLAREGRNRAAPALDFFLPQCGKGSFKKQDLGLKICNTSAICFKPRKKIAGSPLSLAFSNQTDGGSIIVQFEWDKQKERITHIQKGRYSESESESESELSEESESLDSSSSWKENIRIERNSLRYESCGSDFQPVMCTSSSLQPDFDMNLASDSMGLGSRNSSGF